MDRAVMRRAASLPLLDTPDVVFSETGLELPKKMRFEDWRDLGVQLSRAEHSINWWIGDWWAFGEHRYGERKAVVESDDWRGPSFSTCVNCARVARAFAKTHRRQGLSFSHHFEVAALVPAAANALLDEAEHEDWSVRQLRGAVKRKLREGRERALGEKQLAAPTKRYGVILADPPWQFEVYDELTGMDRAADNHYPTMTFEAIKGLDISAADDCVLFLWVTVPFIDFAIELITAWGFTYRSNYVWVKDKFGTGYWNRNRHELLFIASRGRPPAPAPGEQFDSVIEAKAGKHSVKPEEAYAIIESYYPTLPKIEMFARGEAREGWDRWGLEA